MTDTYDIKEVIVLLGQLGYLLDSRYEFYDMDTILKISEVENKQMFRFFTF